MLGKFKYWTAHLFEQVNVQFKYFFIIFVKRTLYKEIKYEVPINNIKIRRKQANTIFFYYPDKHFGLILNLFNFGMFE